MIWELEKQKLGWGDLVTAQGMSVVRGEGFNEQ